jgi:uncharacterized membrane protein
MVRTRWTANGHALIRRASALVAVPLAAALCGAAAGQCQYVVELIEDPPCPPIGEISRPYAINDLGVVVGAYTCALGHEKAFRWTADGGFALLEMPAGVVKSEANDINNAGVIVGTFGGVAVPTRAFVIDGDDFHIIEPPPEGNYTAAEAVNELGDVTGRWGHNVTGPIHAMLWRDGELFDLGPWGESGNSRAYDITDSLEIAGRHSYEPTSQYIAAIWEDGFVTDLGLIPGAISSEARRLNERLDAVGDNRIEDPEAPSIRRRAFRWYRGRMINLGVLPGNDHATCYAVSQTDQIVGICWSGDAEDRAFLVHHDELIDLNTLLVPGGEFEVLSVGDINVHGSIVGYGYFQGDEPIGFILHPLDSPAADINTDCAVDVLDLLLLLSDWGRPDTPSDINEDGVVDVFDLLLLLEQWTY